MNEALLTKLLWKLNMNGGITWRSLITRALDSRPRQLWLGATRLWRLSSIWKKIIKLFPFFVQHIFVQPGRGNKTYFWTDKWTGDITFAEKFNKIFRLARNQECLISDVAPSGQLKEVDWTPLLRRHLNDDEAVEAATLLRGVEQILSTKRSGR